MGEQHTDILANVSELERALSLNADPVAPAQKDAEVLIEVDPDYMAARIRLIPPRGGGKKATEDDILEKLREQRIIKGIKFEYVYRLAVNPVYNETFKIAAGEPPRMGAHGSLKLFFAADATPEKLVTAADYQNIQFETVKEGDLLCEFAPAGKGKNGYNILGQTLEGADGESLPSPAGEGVLLSGDGLALYAAMCGYACVSGDKVHVHKGKTFESLENENVAFDGTVLVYGDVHGGRIEAKGDIIVKGCVQNAQLYATDNIVACKGITGRGCKIKAGGNIRSYFMEQAMVKAEGDIFTDVCLHADITAGGRLYLQGDRASIIGGACKVGGNIYADSVGNHMDVKTSVTLNGLSGLEKAKAALIEQRMQQEQALEKLAALAQRIAGSAKDPKEKQALTANISRLTKETEAALTSIKEQLRGIAAKMKSAAGSVLVIRKSIYPGVILEIDGVGETIAKVWNTCSIGRRNNELYFKRLNEGDKTHAII